MTETSSKTGSSLAITERRQQRSSSCVGVFFQLFDWNRRLANKKLFSKKLFPPVGAKRVSNKFGSDEKMPMAKLLLIADENRGGFPSMKKTGNDGVCSLADGERNNGMRTPGLVARLMGLESMPVVRRDKQRKTPVSNFGYNQGRKNGRHVDNNEKESEFCRVPDLNSEKGLMKADPRPRKLQKTGFFDRRTVSKVGAEALQFKNVLPRSVKQHHKLTTPVKSPRILSGRNAVRLMGAATKILEPGLQATNRARCSLTYSTRPRISLEDHAPTDGIEFSMKQSSNLLNVQSTCNNCGNRLGTVDFCPNVEEQGNDFVSSSSELASSECSNASSHGTGNSIPPAKTSLEQNGDTVRGRSVFPGCHGVVSPAPQSKANFMDSKPCIQRGQNLLAHDRKSQMIIDSNSPKEKNQKCNQTTPAKGRIHERSKLFTHQSRRDSSSGAHSRPKNHVASNRNLSSHTAGMRTPARVLDESKIKMGRGSREKMDDSLSTVKTLVRKRRQVNYSPHIDNMGSFTLEKQRSLTGDVVHRYGVAPYVRSVNRSSVKTAFPKKAEGIGARNSKDADVVSFTFTSTKKHGMPSSFCEEMKKKHSKGEGTCNFSQKEEVTTLKGDALGALLEETLRELTCLERDESATGDTLCGRSTAILQDLISALSIRRQVSQENGENCSDGHSSKDSLYSGSPVCSDCTHVHEMVHSPGSKFQMEAKEVVRLRSFPLAADCDHPSPTSILEASFSNDSCSSESLNCSSGQKLDYGYRHCHLQMQPQLHDPNLLDSATSMSSRKARIDALNNISSLFGIDTTEIGLRGVKLNDAIHIILNAELLFENLAQHDVDGIGAHTLMDPLFLDELEALADHLWGWPRCNLDLPEVGKTQLRGFLFDCMVESLDARYSCFFNSCFREWTKLPSSLSRSRLAAEICEDIKQWRNLAGKDLENMVERDMVWKCVDFKPEVFDTGIEIAGDILQLLLDDMVVDLWQSSAC